MKGKLIRIICVGRLKQDMWQQAWKHYCGQAQKWRKMEVVEIRDSSASLSPGERVQEECARIRNCLSGRDAAVALSEGGKQMSSAAFAEFLRDWDEKEQKRLNFVIGGPFGLSPDFLADSYRLLSLSSMTWPHELARILLAEQIFRAGCILNNFPYHH